eukprot:812837-Prorocentrum_minimum.AAC.1
MGPPPSPPPTCAPPHRRVLSSAVRCHCAERRDSSEHTSGGTNGLAESANRRAGTLRNPPPLLESRVDGCRFPILLESR